MAIPIMNPLLWFMILDNDYIVDDLTGNTCNPTYPTDAN